MSPTRRLLLTLLAVGLALAGLRALVPSDERRIQKLLARLAEEASAPAAGKPLADLAAANRLADFFAPEFHIDLDVPGGPHVAFADRGELVQAILAAKARQGGAQVELLDPRTVELGAKESVVDATAKVQASGEREPAVAELRFTLAKVEGRWRVRKVENVRTFE